MIFGKVLQVNTDGLTNKITSIVIVPQDDDDAEDAKEFDVNDKISLHQRTINKELHQRNHPKRPKQN